MLYYSMCKTIVNIVFLLYLNIEEVRCMVKDTLKRIYDQYIQDMKSIGKSKRAKILFIILMFVPSLYAWFNIAGSWDPYANTGQLKIAVVNQDKGAQMNGVEVNIGTSAIEELKNNKDLNWQFVDKANADEGIRTGTYYASIEFPETLSESVATLSTGNPKQGSILYNYNDKVNAIAPKITSHGALSLQEQIESKIRSTFNTVLFEDVALGGQKLKENRDQIIAGINNLLLLDEKMPELTQQFNQLVTDAELFQKALPTIKETLADSSKKIETLQKKMPELQNLVNQVGAAVELIKNDISTSRVSVDSKIQNIIQELNTLNGLVTTNHPLAVQTIGNIISEVATLKSEVDKAISLITVLNQLTGGNNFSNLLSRLSTLSNQIATMQAPLNQIQTDIAAKRQSTVITSLVANLNASRTQASTLFNDFTTLFQSVSALSSNGVTGIFNIISETLMKYKTIIDTLNAYVLSKEEGLNKAVATGREIQGKIPEWEGQLKHAATLLKPYADGKRLDEMITMLAINPGAVASFLNQPITLEEVRWFPVQNYGAGMTPFYVTLSLWVGVLVLVSIMKVHDKAKEKHGVIFFFGRYLVFLTVIIPQALIVSIGLLLFFGLNATAPLAFVLSSLLIGITFSTIIYTMTYLFGDVGKGVGIVLLVLQLVSAGGTFPIEMMPPFFQNIHMFMPFTYAVSLLHETIGGIVTSVFIKDGVILTLIPIAMFALFMLTHKRLEEPVRKFEEELEQAHIF